MDIRLDNLTRPEIARLLQDHLDEMALHSPPESVHPLDLDGLRKPDVSFWSVREGHELLGCGALKELDRHPLLRAVRRLRRGSLQRVHDSGTMMMAGVIRRKVPWIQPNSSTWDSGRASWPR